MSINPLYEAVLGSSIELKCTVDAIPAPTITWSKIVRDSGDEDWHSVLRQDPGDPKYGCFEMNNITQDVEGSWRCGLSGPYGGHHADFVITVIGT